MGRLNIEKQEGIEKFYVHAFLDGRDTLPDVALTFLDSLTNKLNELGFGKLADISGRYYSMDRERMWNVTKKYYDLLVHGEGVKIDSYKDYIEASYKKNIFDINYDKLKKKDINNLVDIKDNLIFIKEKLHIIFYY